MDIPLPGQLGYASGNLGKSLMWTSLDYLLLFYLTEVAGIAAGWAGAIILVSLLWDASINPIIGYWIDHRAAKGKDYRLLLRWAPIACSFWFVAIFWLPSDIPTVNATYILLALLGFRTAYALLDVPHNALLAYMPVTSDIRMRLAGMRFFFSSIGGLIVATIVAPQFSAPVSVALGFSVWEMAATAGVLLCLTIWQSLDPARLAMVERGQSLNAHNPEAFLRAILHDSTAIRYLCLAAVFALTAPLFAKVLPYHLQYGKAEAALLSPLLIALTLGQLTALPFWTVILMRVSAKVVGPVALLGLATSLTFLTMLNETTTMAIMLATSCIGLCLGGVIQVIWGTAGNVADLIAERSDVRVDGGVLALLTFVQKAAIGLGAMLTGIALDLSGFESGATQTPGILCTIEAIALVIPAVGAVVTCYLLVQLNRRLFRG